MPSPARTSRQAIVDAGRELLEREGLEGLTMQAVASAVGVRAPSLYKRLRDRGELIRLVSDATARDLAARLEAVPTGDPRRDLGALATTVRAFALECPAGYGLLFAQVPDAWRVDPELNARAVAPILGTVGRLVGPDEALDAARLVVAWVNGFVSMELAGAFRLGGDVDRAFRYGVDRLTEVLGGRSPAS
jgi:AcrR family transcriptional regulator